MKKPLRGLFLNTEKDICSIYESGKMSYDCLAQSVMYTLDYVELSANKREISLGYDFYLFNYHWVKMGWLDTRRIRQLPGFKATLVLEMSQDSPFDCVPKEHFDAYLVLDPTCRHYLDNVYPFPRPLELGSGGMPGYFENSVPTIGTFGLSFSDKGFDEVVRATDREFDSATVRINVPKSSNVTERDVLAFKSELKGIALKGNINIELTDHYFEKQELINWCAKNTINVFLYNRRIGNGLSATTDQAIASGRPMAVSTNPTFRHIHDYIKPYPYMNLRESIQTSASSVKRMQEDWSPSQFMSKFEAVLRENNVRSVASGMVSLIKLPAKKKLLDSARNAIAKHGVSLFLPPIVKLTWDRMTARQGKTAGSALTPYTHKALLSHSQFQEDMLIELLLSKRSSGFYIDINAPDPIFHNNTRRFYSMGWRGINMVGQDSVFAKFEITRPFDFNLKIEISGHQCNRSAPWSGNASPIPKSHMNAASTGIMAKDGDRTSHAFEGIKTLASVFGVYLAGRGVDFMMVDAVGNDLEVLMGNDWEKYRPTLVILKNPKVPGEVVMLMDKCNYMFILSNQVNMMFVDKLTTDQDVKNRISWNG